MQNTCVFKAKIVFFMKSFRFLLLLFPGKSPRDLGRGGWLDMLADRLARHDRLAQVWMALLHAVHHYVYATYIISYVIHILNA